jgi:hypothetical protein
LNKLQELERLSFPFSNLDVGAMALHLSGSGNTYPAGVYTSLFKKPNLAWVLGHEATHLMVAASPVKSGSGPPRKAIWTDSR